MEKTAAELIAELEKTALELEAAAEDLSTKANTANASDYISGLVAGITS